MAKKIIKYNFVLSLISLIISVPFGFNNLGIIWILEGLPLTFLITLILNIIFVGGNKELSLKHKMGLIILMPIMVTVLNLIASYLIGFIAWFGFSYQYMATRL